MPAPHNYTWHARLEEVQPLNCGGASLLVELVLQSTVSSTLQCYTACSLAGKGAPGRVTPPGPVTLMYEPYNTHLGRSLPSLSHSLGEASWLVLSASDCSLRQLHCGVFWSTALK